jgi:hypothetical protein
LLGPSKSRTGYCLLAGNKPNLLGVFPVPGHLQSLDQSSTKVLWNRQQQQAATTDTKRFESQAVHATVDYLIWSWVTTVFWIVEVALGAAFPSVSEEDFRDDQHLIVDNVPGATLEEKEFYFKATY